MKNRKQNGFTLIELVAVVGIIGMIFSIILVLFHSGLAMYSNGMKIESTETNRRLALEELTNNLKVSKIIIPTSVVTTDLHFYGFSYDAAGNNQIAQTNLIAYIEDYNGNRYLYALKPNSLNNDLYKIALSNQINNKYSLTETTPGSHISTEATLTAADHATLAGPDLNYVLPNIDATKYLTNFSQFDYATSGLNTTPTLMYDNYGNCYLIVYKTASDRVKIKLNLEQNYDHTVLAATKICEYVLNISIANVKTEADININIQNNAAVENTETYVNILNQNN